MWLWLSQNNSSGGGGGCYVLKLLMRLNRRVVVTLGDKNDALQAGMEGDWESCLRQVATMKFEGGDDGRTKVSGEDEEDSEIVI